jgi:uncharacterized membrane protein SirB2
MTEVRKDAKLALPPLARAIRARGNAEITGDGPLTMYASLKALHVISVALSYTLFVLRGIWMMQDSAWLQRRWVKIVPHVIDTVLLTSAIALAVTVSQYPFVNDWLTAKVLALLLYIGLGMLAIKLGRTKSVRVGAWVLAQMVFLYIVAVARTRDPIPFLQ